MQSSRLRLREMTWPRLRQYLGEPEFDSRSPCCRKRRLLPQPPRVRLVESPWVPSAPPSSSPVAMDEDIQVPRGARIGLSFLLPNLIPLLSSPCSQARSWLITDFHSPIQPPAHLVGPRQGLGICNFGKHFGGSGSAVCPQSCGAFKLFSQACH